VEEGVSERNRVLALFSDDMLKEASGGRPEPARIEEKFWKID
jgi:hypothetical protein